MSTRFLVVGTYIAIVVIVLAVLLFSSDVDAKPHECVSAAIVFPVYAAYKIARNTPWYMYKAITYTWNVVVDILYKWITWGLRITNKIITFVARLIRDSIFYIWEWIKWIVWWVGKITMWVVQLYDQIIVMIVNAGQWCLSVIESFLLTIWLFVKPVIEWIYTTMINVIVYVHHWILRIAAAAANHILTVLRLLRWLWSGLCYWFWYVMDVLSLVYTECIVPIYKTVVAFGSFFLNLAIELYTRITVMLYRVYIICLDSAGRLWMNVTSTMTKTMDLIWTLINKTHEVITKMLVRYFT
jgi:hypothetical protein